MTKNSRDQKKFLKKTMASGLVVSVLLTVLPGCTARHMPDWSRVQAVSPQTKTHVRLYSNRKVRGRFHSAADDSLTLTLRDGQERTLPKESVHKVLTRRAWWEGLPGWIVVAASASLAGWVYSLQPSEPDAAIAYAELGGIIAAVTFYRSRTNMIYNVPSQHRTPPPRATQPDAGKKAPSKPKDPQ